MKKVLLLAYAVSPTKGSEYSVSWNFIVNMSKDIELVVLYGTSGNHLGDVDDLMEYIKNNPIPNVEFIPIKPNRKAEKLNLLNKKGIFLYSFYFAFHEWHKQVFEFCKDLIQREKFDLIHYLTPIGYREPGFLWKLGLPYVWGPIGGTYSVPKGLTKALNGRGLLKLGFRKIINFIQLKYKLSVERAIRNTDVLIASTTYDQNVLSKRFNKKVLYLPENGIINKFHFDNKDFNTPRINLVWIGSIDERKALIILLEALTRISKNKYILHVVGSGFLESKMKEFAIKNNINDCIVWHGLQPRKKVYEIIGNSHLHILTGITEGNPTTLWEAMSANTPSLSLDHCGMHDIICEKCGIKIPITSYQEIVNNIASKISYYYDNRDKLKILTDGVGICADNYKWENRIPFWEEVYNSAILNRKNKKM